jgi:hypothetical protein
MSDLLVHWAVFDDCRRLAQVDRQIDPLLREWVQSEREAGRLGAVSRGGSRTLAVVLPWARDRWPDASGDAPRKVAFVLGALTHASADRLMKPLMSRCAGADWNEIHHQMQGRPAVDTGPAEAEARAIQEISAYYEAHVFRQVYLSGAEEPFNRFLLADNATAPGRALEAFVRALFQRALLSCHTLDPDSDDVQGWLDRLFGAVQPLYLDVDLWVQVFQRPEPAKQERFLVETAFYRADDPAIRVARALQAGQPVGAAQVESALRAEANESRYGQALQTGVRYLRAASAFWRREIEWPELRVRLDAGRSPDETHPLTVPALATR